MYSMCVPKYYKNWITLHHRKWIPMYPSIPYMCQTSIPYMCQTWVWDSCCVVTPFLGLLLACLKLQCSYNLTSPLCLCFPLFFFQTTPLDKEQQGLREQRYQNVKSLLPHGSYVSHGLSPADINSESEDCSQSSADTVRSPVSPF